MAFPLMMVKTRSILLLLILVMLNGWGTSSSGPPEHMLMNRVGPVRFVTNLLWNANWHMLLVSTWPLMTLIARSSGKNFVLSVRLMAGTNAVVVATIFPFAPCLTASTVHGSIVCRPLCTLPVVLCVDLVIKLSVLLVSTDLSHPLDPP